jgi:hypothetical protein
MSIVHHTPFSGRRPGAAERYAAAARGEPPIGRWGVTVRVSRGGKWRTVLAADWEAGTEPHVRAAALLTIGWVDRVTQRAA